MFELTTHGKNHSSGRFDKHDPDGWYSNTVIFVYSYDRHVAIIMREPYEKTVAGETPENSAVTYYREGQPQSRTTAKHVTISERYFYRNWAVTSRTLPNTEFENLALSLLRKIH